MFRDLFNGTRSVEPPWQFAAPSRNEEPDASYRAPGSNPFSPEISGFIQEFHAGFPAPVRVITCRQNHRALVCPCVNFQPFEIIGFFKSREIVPVRPERCICTPSGLM
jgi:hypothetical protein